MGTRQGEGSHFFCCPVLLSDVFQILSERLEDLLDSVLKKHKCALDGLYMM